MYNTIKAMTSGRFSYDTLNLQLQEYTQEKFINS